MRDVAIVASAQTNHETAIKGRNEIEMMMPVVAEAMSRSGLTKDDIGFTCSGSSDFLAGQAFSFVTTLDAVGAWPPISESHVEMDGAWALYEAWVKMQMGEVDAALVYSYGKSSPGDIAKILTTQLDPYYMAPLWPDAIDIAALQARAALDAGAVTKEAMAEVASRSRRDARTNPHAHLTGVQTATELLAGDELVPPLHRHDCPPVTDGGVAVVLAAGDLARTVSDRPAWIRGLDHRIEAHALGSRDLISSTSTRIAADHVGLEGRADLAELHAPFTHQELLLTTALSLGADTTINPSGGALAANPIMAAGLIRLAEAATRISGGQADRAVAHATSGPALQQNLVCVLEGE